MHDGVVKKNVVYPHFWWMGSDTSGKYLLEQILSKKAMKKTGANTKKVFSSPNKLLLSIEKMVKVLNPKIIGMRNYYARWFTRPWLWKIKKYINYKFTRWYNRKKQRNYST